jgi:hypothetical protein
VLALVVLVLIGAYRALGGGPPRAADSAALLRTAAAGLHAALTDLSESLATAPLAEQTTQSGRAREGRRTGAAARQILDSLPGDELDEQAAAARALLDAAAEDTSWAWRMIAAGSNSPGLTRAVEALRDHAAECCASADALLLATPAGKPVDGA